MKQDKERFLNLRNIPARLTAEQAAWLLGFEAHDIPKLVNNRILRPLGKPAKNCVKMFWSRDVTDLANDRDKISKASDAIKRGGQTSKSIHPFEPRSLADAA